MSTAWIIIDLHAWAYWWNEGTLALAALALVHWLS